MKTFKLLSTIAILSLFTHSGFAAAINVACTVNDERFQESTGLSQVLVADLLGIDPQSNFPDAAKDGDTIVTESYITMSFSNGENNYYSFSLEKSEVDEVIALGAGEVTAEVRFTNDKTAPYEQHLRDGQLLKMLVMCSLQI